MPRVVQHALVQTGQVDIRFCIQAPYPFVYVVLGSQLVVFLQVDCKVESFLVVEANYLQEPGQAHHGHKCVTKKDSFEIEFGPHAVAKQTKHDAKR